MYGNPYYEPYQGYNQEYLEHYGVKGMKWGVRHDDKPTGSGLKRRGKGDTGTRKRSRTSSETMAKMTKRSHDILKEQMSYPYDNADMQYALDVYDYKARYIYDSQKGWDVDPKTGEWVGSTKEEDAKLMEDAYAQVAETYTDLERAMLAMYVMLKQWGMTDRFSVVLYGDTDSEAPSIGLYDLQKKDVVPTLDEAHKRMRLDKKSSRRREVDPNAKPVRPKKSEQPADIGLTANPYFSGTIDPLKALNVDEKKLKHSMIPIDYSRYCVSVGTRAIRDLGRYGTLSNSI